MKVFVVVGFKGKWPVGTAAVVVAKDATAARKLVDVELRKRGLPPLAGDKLVELDTRKAGATILLDGDY